MQAGFENRRRPGDPVRVGISSDALEHAKCVIAAPGGSGGEPNALLRKYVGAKPAKTVMAAASDIAVKKLLSACGVAIVL